MARDKLARVTRKLNGQLIHQLLLCIHLCHDKMNYDTYKSSQGRYKQFDTQKQGQRNKNMHSLVIYRRQLKFDKNDKVCYAARKKSMQTLNRIGLFSRPSLFNLYTNETNVNKRIWEQKQRKSQLTFRTVDSTGGRGNFFVLKFYYNSSLK